MIDIEDRDIVLIGMPKGVGSVGTNDVIEAGLIADGKEMKETECAYRR